MLAIRNYLYILYNAKKLLQLARGLLATSLGQSAASARPVSFTEIQDLQIEPSEKETHINKRMMR